jgi:hypothetical protein
MSNYYPYYYYNSSNNNQNASPINNNSNFYEIRFVICPFCGSQAHVKPTKTHRLMLRCDLCRALMFANAETSQKYLLNLPEYREYLF